MRGMLVCGVLLQPLFWFGIPALTAKSAFIAGSNALHSPRELRGNKSRLAARLGVSRTTLIKKIREYGIEEARAEGEQGELE